MNLILFEEHETNAKLKKRDARAVHLLKVLHKKEGDTFEAGLLGGKSGKGKIEKINNDGSIDFSLDLNEQPLQRLALRIAVGFPRPIQIRRILRDLSSMGVSAIDFFATELGEKSYRDTKLFDDGGARAALIEGAMQSRDTTVPELAVYDSLKKWLEMKPWEGRPLLAALDNVLPTGVLADITVNADSAVLAIGSERGWSDKERLMLEKAGFLRLSLGSRALRTETACIAAAALLLGKITGKAL